MKKTKIKNITRRKKYENNQVDDIDNFSKN